MALDAGIEMSKCKLYTENGSSHFMTKRFDRIGTNGEKLHMQSLCDLAHMDFNAPRNYSYTEAFTIMKQLKLPYSDFTQLFKRMVYNEYAKNYDDHTKNISFLMDKTGVWSLSPAYYVTFSNRPDSTWVSAHQMLINGKADNITDADMLRVAERAGIKKSDAKNIIDTVKFSVAKWDCFAEEAGLSKHNIARIKKFSHFKPPNNTDIKKTTLMELYTLTWSFFCCSA